MNKQENIAVVDAGANLVAFIRMDDAWLGLIDVAINKAKMARFFDMPTADLGKMAQPGESLWGLALGAIKDRSGVIIGAIGASGSTTGDDIDVAKAALKAVGE